MARPQRRDPPTRMHCTGCHRVIDVARPPGVSVQVRRERDDDGREQISVWVGQVIVHRCTLCRNGIWR